MPPVTSTCSLRSLLFTAFLHQPKHLSDLSLHLSHWILSCYHKSLLFILQHLLPQQIREEPITHICHILPSFAFMSSLVLISLLLLLSFHSTNAQPNPGYYPSYQFKPSQFYRAFLNLWGPQHQTVTGDQSSTTIWLDRTSGSGFKSKHPYISGYFGSSIKLQPGYTAGVITAFYLSNNQAHPGHHDEVDIEFLGTTPGRPYTLQTNVYIRGSGDGRIIGREMKFHLWFDPTAAFHNYAISWTPYEIIFFVDDIPIRRYQKKSDSTYPLRPMWLYGSIWDASSWATDNGKYKADYRYQPFVARFTKFILRGCTSPYSRRHCRTAPSSSSGGGLSNRQYMAMHWAQTRHMVYNYCKDPKRDHSLTPECWN